MIMFALISECDSGGEGKGGKKEEDLVVVVQVEEGLAEPMLVAMGVQELYLLDDNQPSCMFNKQRFVNYIMLFFCT